MKNTDNNQLQEIKKKEKGTWIFLWCTMFLGIFFVLLVSVKSIIISAPFASNFFYYLRALGLGLLVAGTCFCVGGLLGLLFGIPRSTNGSSEQDGKRTLIFQNDNLVQISDWMTKIIVGVGLTQLHQIPVKLKILGEYLSSAFNNNNPGDTTAEGVAIIVVLYFISVGFLCGYLWTRLNFSALLAQNIKELEDIMKALTLAKQRLAEVEEVSASKDGLIAQRQVEVEALSNSLLPGILELKNKEKIDDPQKGQWGGSSERNERLVEASVTATSYDDELFNISLKVNTTNPLHPLTGEVKFHLHDTFINPIRVVKVKDGMAQLHLVAYGAFTVGVECDQGQTKLELDLAELTDAPIIFKNS
jgi:hypothetical protein